MNTHLWNRINMTIFWRNTRKITAMVIRTTIIPASATTKPFNWKQLDQLNQNTMVQRYDCNSKTAYSMNKPHKEARTLTHFQPYDKILVIGECNFAVASSMGSQFKSAKHITALCFLTEDIASKCETTADNIKLLRKLNGTLMFGSETMPTLKSFVEEGINFDKVMIMHPVTLSKEPTATEIALAKESLKKLLSTASGVSQELYLTLKSGNPFDRLDIRALVSEIDLVISHKGQVTFPYGDYPRHKEVNPRRQKT